MARLLWLADIARDAGLTVKEVSGWQTRGADSMNPRGVIAHHTATSASRPGDYPSLDIIINGRPDLPGPLSQYGLGRSGAVYVCAAGKANHAGLGQWDTRLKGGTDFLDHSTEVIGIEAEHPGLSSVPWPAAQLDAYHRLCAAILLHLNRPVANLCGHKEWAQPPESTPNRKPDPISLDMDEFRSTVQLYMEDNMHTIKDHAAYHKQGANPWGDGAWASYKMAGYTTLDNSRTWEARREDLAWFREKLLAEVGQNTTTIDIEALTNKVVAEVIKRLSNG